MAVSSTTLSYRPGGFSERGNSPDCLSGEFPRANSLGGETRICAARLEHPRGQPVKETR
jgi:hypothetical protein